MRRAGHDRTAVQCAVRWKNIMSAYKESREILKSTPDKKVCSFYKDIEDVLGHAHISHISECDGKPTASTSDIEARLSHAEDVDASTRATAPVEVKPSFSRAPQRRDTAVVQAIQQLREMVEAQGLVLLRLEKALTQLLTRFDANASVPIHALHETQNVSHAVQDVPNDHAQHISQHIHHESSPIHEHDETQQDDCVAIPEDNSVRENDRKRQKIT